MCGGMGFNKGDIITISEASAKACPDYVERLEKPVPVIKPVTAAPADKQIKRRGRKKKINP